jgi:nucleotide-binding universal stress UspA family protein
MQFKKVLVAVDNSEHGKKAIRAGIQLAKKLDAEIAFVYGIEYMVNFTSHDNIVVPVEMFELQKAEAQKTLDEMSKMYDGTKTIKHFIPEGSAKDEILATADTWSADIIVIGTHGRTGLSHLLLGSVAEYVVRHAKVPVLVVPIKESK